MHSNVFTRVWHWLARPGVMVVLIVALLGVMAAGTLLPQAPEVTPGSPQDAEWRALARDRYGALAATLEAAGALRLYRTPWLWIPMVLLGLATLSCLVQRWHGYWHAAFSQPVLIPDTVLDAAPNRCNIDPSPLSEARDRDALYTVVQLAFSRRDYRVRAESSQDGVWLRGDRNRLSRLGTLAEHMAVLLILLGVALGLMLGWRETLTIEPGETAGVGHRAEIVVRNDGFEIARYADGSPATYTALVTIESGENVQHRDLGVNQPTMTRGVRLYLQGYRPVGKDYAVTLLAVNDPGYWVVLVGGILFLAGIGAALYFPRCTVHARISEDGTLRLAGWSERRAYDFEAEFAGLAAELGREADRARPNLMSSKRGS